MEVALKEAPRKLREKINYCRRYLQVVTLTDLFLHDASRIHPDVMRCRRPTGRLANYMWPDFPPPTKACIVAWKAFLIQCESRYRSSLANDDWQDLQLYSHSLGFYYNFGSKMLYRYCEAGCWATHQPVPGSRSLRGMWGKCRLEASESVQFPPQGAVPVEVEQAVDAFVVMAVSSRHLTAFRIRQQREEQVAEEPVMLSERFAALPPLLKQLCGKVDLPIDGGAALAMYVMETGRKLYGVSDGSAKAGAGTHGWRICRFPGDELALQGSGFVDGVNTTPFRAETQGQLAILIAMTVLAQRWGFTMLGIMSICDNKAVIKRLAKAYRDSRLADHKDPDADLYTVYREWAKQAPVTCTHRWVKGHQDRDTAFEDLPAEAKINCEVDVLAGMVYDQPMGTGNVSADIPTFASEVYSVYTEAGKVTGGLRKGILAQSGKAELEAYYEGKHRLFTGKREGVNWIGLASLLRAQPPHKRASFVKYQHGWLPTNGFLYKKQGRAASSLCPLCGVKEETIEHVQCCEAPAAVSYRKKRLDDCLSSLMAAGTAPEIVNCWGRQVSVMFGLPEFQPKDLLASRCHTAISKAVAEARRHQAVLSWQGFLQGRLSVRWNRLQELHQRLRRKPPKKGLPWRCKSVRLVGAIVLDMWCKRNEWVHGATLAEAKVRRRERVVALVKAVYRRNPKLLPRFQSIRAVQLDARLASPVEVLHVWLQQIERQEKVMAAVQEKAAMRAGSILRFLVPRQLTGTGSGGEHEAAMVFDRGR